MELEAYKELSDKVEGVKDSLNKTMTEVLVEMGRIVGKLDALQAMKTDVDTARDTARDALRASTVLDRDIDNLTKEVRPLLDANLSERLRKLEKIVTWAATTTLGGIILGGISLLFFYAKGGK